MPIYREWPNQDGVYCECENRGNKQVTVGSMRGLGEGEFQAANQTLLIFGVVVLGGLFLWGMKQ